MVIIFWLHPVGCLCVLELLHFSSCLQKADPSLYPHGPEPVFDIYAARQVLTAQIQQCGVKGKFPTS